MAIEATFEENPTSSGVTEVLSSLQQSVKLLNEKVVNLEKKVYSLEDSNFKLNKKIQRVSHRAVAGPSRKSLKSPSLDAFSPVEEEKARKKKEEKKNIMRANSFGGGGIFNDYTNEDDDDDDDPLEHGLGHDTFSLLKVKEVRSYSWVFTMVVYFFQVTLLSMILVTQYNEGTDSSPFGIPFQVNISVRLGQIIALLVTTTLSRDIFLPFKELTTLWFTNEDEWLSVTGPLKEKRAFPTWCIRILLPEILQLFVGALALIISFVIIVQSEDVITLFADFAAMSVIAELDNIAFWFAENGYVGDKIMNDAMTVQRVSITDNFRKLKIGRYIQINLRSLLFIALVLLISAGFAPIVYLQETGAFFALKYPYCTLQLESINTMGDGECDGGIQNSYECGFDHGDCTEFRIAYRGCDVTNPSTVGNKICDAENNVKDCSYDGGDCCPINVDHTDFLKYWGDDKGECHAGHFFTPQCLYDKGDCDKIREEYTNCPPLERLVLDEAGQPVVIGNGICDQGKKDIAEYMNDECGWVFGDCKQWQERNQKRLDEFPACTLPDIFRIGDGICDRQFLNEPCGWDKMDCCNLDESKVGDGVCDSDGDINFLIEECAYEKYDCCPVKSLKYVNDGNCGDSLFFPDIVQKEDLAYNAECSFEGSDCFIPNYPDCFVDKISRIGDGTCHGRLYNTEECGFDGGDCLELNEKYPGCNFRSVANIGNGLCDKKELNVPECGYDGGDCLLFNAKYPDCEVGDQMFKIGNGFCDHSAFQPFSTEECNYDGGDCDENGNPIFNPLSEFNIKYPLCNAEIPNRVGDGYCRGDYNTKECGFDGGDCLELNLRIIGLGLDPSCAPDFPAMLGDGICHGSSYNTEACGYDGGDCIEFNNLYPNCITAFPRQIGNGQCNPMENTEECGWDGGDCLLEDYPDCHVSFPYYIGDGECDSSPEYFNEECGWDGGDCD